MDYFPERIGSVQYEFETFLVRALKSLGFENIGSTPASGDQGADVVATRNGKTIAIQAKRYARPVGNSAIQEIVAALRFYKADEGWVITNSIFTDSAKKLARANGVRLVDGIELRKMLGQRQNLATISHGNLFNDDVK